MPGRADVAPLPAALQELYLRNPASFNIVPGQVTGRRARARARGRAAQASTFVGALRPLGWRVQ